MIARRASRLLLPALCLVGVLLFTALGVWQVERRAWKLDLIDRVESRITAPPVPITDLAAWRGRPARDIEYRRVSLSGTFRHERETLVDALTEAGPGFWVMTPLQTVAGTILINRGFIPKELVDPRNRPLGQVAGVQRITGLVRMSEPEGRILRPNDPAWDRWFSRDVAAIGAARDMGRVAPFFVDADATANPGGWPRGGMTVVRFRNAHLSYALTWFGLALLSLFGFVLVMRSGQERR